MFVYTTSNIYLTPRFKFWNLLIKFSWNCYLSKVYKETMVLMTNDNLLYCMIWLSMIRCSSWNFQNIYVLIGKALAYAKKEI